MDPSRIAVLGGTGQLGTDLVETLRNDGSFEVLSFSHVECDCTKADEVDRVLQDCRPGAVINCAAYVRVDDSERHIEEAFEINAIGAFRVARICSDLGAVCVYISTDYVFGGQKTTPYVESDPPGPINVYGASKLAGEYLVRQAAPRSLIVRLASLYGETGARAKGGNFVETVIAKAKAGEQLRIVDDIRISPTYTRDAAAGVAALLKDREEGIIHLTNAGSCTWYEFAKRSVEVAGIEARIEPIRSEEYPTRARRAKNSALESERSSVKLRSWQDALAAYITERTRAETIVSTVAR